MDVLFPELGALAEIDSDPEFVIALRRIMGKVFFERGNPIRGYREINYFAEKASGHMVLLDLMDAAEGRRGRALPQSRAVKNRASDRCSEGCGVSRRACRQDILRSVERRGLVATYEGPGGSAIRPTPLLIEKFLEWMATQFLFFADCAGEAMAKRAAARRATPPAIPPRAIFRRREGEKGQHC